MASASELDMSLDEIIKLKKVTRGAGGRGGRGARGVPVGRKGGVAQRRNNNTAAFRGAFRAGASASVAAAYGGRGAAGAMKALPRDLDNPWQHDLFGGAAPAAIGGLAGVPAAAGRGLETGTKLYVSNLDFGVSNEDIKELFSGVGDLKRSSVHYDRSGRSKGTAEVVFARKNDAVTALQRFNNVTLDGKPLKIEIIGTNMAVPVPVAQRIVVAPVAPKAMKKKGAPAAWGGSGAAAFRAPIGGGGRRGQGALGRGGRGGRGGGRGGREKKAPKSQEELDAELDSYHAQAGGGGSEAMES